ncbi:MAG: hypothetical protein OXI11_02890 [Gammaproteobacteria bacterium]|nr:hypothetical protein [Gammaproteobacteria bacterium]
MPVTISVAVEGAVDEAVMRKIVAHAGGQTGGVYGKNGKPDLLQKLDGYNNAARHAPWIVLVDLNGDAECAPSILNDWAPAPAPTLCFRIAVREVESWLIADAPTFAKYLSIRPGNLPPEPENLERPKDTVVNLARRSQRRFIRQDMVPREGSGRRVGPAYASRLIEYIKWHWRPNAAAQRSDSLRRAIACIEKLVANTRRQETGSEKDP